MIHPKEINKIASQYKLSDLQVEKDYILSWILYGIANNKTLSEILVFKGGTVLKKTYFEDYRFSEDLDFTLINEDINNEQIISEFNTVYEFVKDQANIDLKFKESDVHESGSLVFWINYVGPLQGAMGSRDVKIDITRGETLEYAYESRKVFVTYTDLPEDSFYLSCYALSEVLIEKMAALMGRLEPRDLYDFWYLTEVQRLDTKHYKPEFERKAKNKKNDPSEFARKVLAKEKNLKQGWEKKLANQIYDLPNFDDVFREAKRNFKF